MVIYRTHYLEFEWHKNKPKQDLGKSVITKLCEFFPQNYSPSTALVPATWEAEGWRITGAQDFKPVWASQQDSFSQKNKITHVPALPFCPHCLHFEKYIFIEPYKEFFISEA